MGPLVFLTFQTLALGAAVLALADFVIRFIRRVL